MTTIDIGSSWHSYPKVWALGHKAITDLLLGRVVVQEKIDGSQISFGMFDGELRIRSKAAIIDPENPEGMFRISVENIKAIANELRNGWTYRGEYLQKPKHNALCYDRVPDRHIILFDINTGHEEYLTPYEVSYEATTIGLESVPTIVTCEGADIDSAVVVDFLKRTSCLGGPIEGVVIKNYGRFTPDGKAMMGKFVSEQYKEIHKGEWKVSNPTSGDIIEVILNKIRTPARWEKAVQHLREKGALQGDPRDIGPLIKEVQDDTVVECVDEISKALLAWAMPHIRRGCSRGVPEWYKTRLLDAQFAQENAPCE